MSGNLQSGIHPDADQLSVFVEGAATAREQERMLAHLAECADCRKAVFLMQPHEKTQAATAAPAKGWMWQRLLLPVGLPAAALGCALIAVLISIRPHGGTPGTPLPSAKERQPEIERPGTTVAPTTKLERAPSTNSEQVARSGRRQSSFAPRATATNHSRRENSIASGFNSLALENEQATKNVAPQTTGAAPSASAPSSDAALAQNAVSPASTSDLLLNGQDVANIKPPQPADTKDAASQSLVRKKELPGLVIDGASVQADTLAGVSGRVTDRTGAIIAGATVTLRDTSGKTRQTTTGSDGSFRLTDLPAGQYELMATAKGFAAKKQPIELKPSEVAMLQPMLDVGATSETVEVQAAAPAVQTEASVSGQVIEGMSGADRVIAGPAGLPAATVSHGKQFLSLDSAGNLFLSRNGGKKWKKINPQWAGKAVRIELTPAAMSEAPPQSKNETSAQASAMAIFQLTTDAHAVWTSKDGKHWHQQ